MTRLVGLLDRPGFPAIGRAYLGSPKDAKGGAGKPLTYFRFVFDKTGVDGGTEIDVPEVEKEFRAIYHNEPNDVLIGFLLPHVEDIWHLSNTVYDGSGRLIHECSVTDGKISYEIDKATGEKKVVGGVDVKTGEIRYCDGSPIYYYQNKNGETVGVKCSARGLLRFALPELHRFAEVTLVLTSAGSIKSVRQQLYALEAVTHLAGKTLAGLRLIMRRVPRKGWRTLGDGKRIQAVTWVVELEPVQSWAKDALATMFDSSYLSSDEIVGEYEDDGEDASVSTRQVEAPVSAEATEEPDPVPPEGGEDGASASAAEPLDDASATDEPPAPSNNKATVGPEFYASVVDDQSFKAWCRENGIDGAGLYLAVGGVNKWRKENPGATWAQLAQAVWERPHG